LGGSKKEFKKEELKAWKLEFTRQAFEDVQNAVDYYDERSLTLGDAFMEDLNSAVKTLTINPYFQIQ
jgi:hypothetical protein